ncbi:MAG: DNA polymerase III subunit delta [Peptostreptococcaceae bacterium]|nr:DNA polymerase III subunit delta [Peptostreptococcaceae bacterium]
MAYGKKQEPGYRDFNTQISKNSLKNVIFLYGKEDFLIKWAIDRIIGKYINKDYKQLDVVKLDGDIVSVDEINMNASTYSMLSDKRVVVIRNYLPLFKKNVKDFNDKEEEKLFNIIEDSNIETMLIFYLDSDKSEALTKTGKDLAKRSNNFLFDKLDERDLRGFVKKRFDSSGLNYSKNIIDYSIEVSGYLNKESNYYLIDLANDINKMIELSDEGNITEKEVNLSVLGSDDTYIFNLLDAICTNDKKTAMNIAVNKMKNDDNVFQMLSLITSQFEIMYDIREMEEDGIPTYKISEDLGINKYRFNKAYMQSKKFTKKALKEDLIQLYDIDRQIKSGELQEELVLPVFISKI